MSYIRVTLNGPGYKFVSNTHSMRVYLKGKERNPKRERTPEEMERQNARNRALKVQLLILGNFKEGWHVTLTYAKEARPPDAEGAKKELKRFLDRAGRRFKKAGIEFKWLAVTEIGSHGAVHHHLIIEDINEEGFSSQKVVRECWNGGKYFSPMYEDGEYQSLSEYLVKKETKEDVPGCKVSHSRNLIMPKKKREKMRGHTWFSDPKVPKGWELVKESLHNGINAFTGLPCQSYLLIEVKDASKHIHSFNNKDHPSIGRNGPIHSRDGDWRSGGYSYG
jgi:hypothetical protein